MAGFRRRAKHCLHLDRPLMMLSCTARHTRVANATMLLCSVSVECTAWHLYIDFSGTGARYIEESSKPLLECSSILGIVLFQIRHVYNRHFIAAAKVVAEYTIEQQAKTKNETSRLYPDIEEIRELSVQIAKRLAEICYEVSLDGQRCNESDVFCTGGQCRPLSTTCRH